AAALCATASGQAPKAPTLDGKPPVVIAHRGASGYRPEHTLEAYSLAIDQGADYVEPDLVMTKDGVLVARHEPFIDGTTDVASRAEFADRRRSTTVDGVLRSGYFVSDFTLAELKTLRAVQPYPGRDKQHDGKFQVPTLDEVIALVKKRSTELKRTIGIYPEVKHSTWHSSIGLPIEDKLLATLAREGWNKRESPVVIQSFEVTNLQYLRSKSQVRLAQLLSASGRPYDLAMKNDPRDYRSMATPAGLADIRKYADIVGANKRLIVGSSGFGNESQRTLTPPTTLIADAHKLGLQVHAWTFRSERDQLASDYKNDPAAEYRQFFSLGVDGVISDFPDVAVRVRDGR
ncbi:MAG TPA: glycerophosphodiester phosphodiesterase, partial [Deinococcales bacterium]|nr:glycerophosphodiester phosphodiesterase [Deinococcales bacterium]